MTRPIPLLAALTLLTASCVADDNSDKPVCESFDPVDDLQIQSALSGDLLSLSIQTAVGTLNSPQVTKAVGAELQSVQILDQLGRPVQIVLKVDDAAAGSGTFTFTANLRSNDAFNECPTSRDFAFKITSGQPTITALTQLPEALMALWTGEAPL